MHQINGNYFGFDSDNYCGKTPQVNTPCADGFDFFLKYRLATQIELASDAGLMNKNDITIVESIAQKLNQFIPKQPASLLHGDLWNGNVIYSHSGPALIDPATYYGWAEADLAMTRLFGGFDDTFYHGYQEVRPLEPGFEERAPLYNLYHLLNHLNLFGSGWYDSVMAVARRYASGS
jgi:fructosamine-3-kinase